MGKIDQIRKLPKLTEVAKMSHDELLSNLVECPESPMFAQRDIVIEESVARRYVAEFVDRARFSAKPAIDEARLSQEGSSNRLINQNEVQDLLSLDSLRLGSIAAAQEANEAEINANEEQLIA